MFWPSQYCYLVRIWEILCYFISIFSLVLSSDLNLAVLDFTIRLVETGVENDVLLALIIFSFQYVLVNHEYWKYRIKHIRFKITLKVSPASLLKLLNFILFWLFFSEVLLRLWMTVATTTFLLLVLLLSVYWIEPSVIHYFISPQQFCGFMFIFFHYN